MKQPTIRPSDWHVLQMVHRAGAVPQHKLAEHMGRQRSTVSDAVRRLLASGWLRHAGQEGAGRGRPAILLSVDRGVGCFAGVDIAAAELHVAVAAIDGALLDRATVRLGEDHSPAALVEQVELTLRGLLSRLDIRIDRLLGLWAGINGAVSDEGVVVTCAALGWHDVELRSLLADRCGCEVVVQGGSTATIAAAEAMMGAGRTAETLVYYHAGRGISARFVHRGRHFAGATQRAGEIGHVVVEPGGPRCACGNRGCLEAVASGPAVVAAIRKLPRAQVPESVRKLLAGAEDEDAPAVVQAALHGAGENGHSALREILERMTHQLAFGAAMAVSAYDPELLVLGGYLFEMNPPLRKTVTARLRKLVLDGASRSLRVVEGEIIAHDRAVGGAAEMCHRFWANPRGTVGT